MSKSTSCNIIVLVALVALVVGALGFAAGFLTHTVMLAAEPEETLVLEVDTMPGDEPFTSAEASPVDSSESAPGAEEDEAFQLFWEAWRLIERDYYGAIPNDDEMTYGAIRGAVNTLGDPFTAFISPEIAEINREDDTGSFQGIGAYVTMRDGRLMIVNTFRDHPAEKAGVRRGDIVLQVDDTVIENMSVYEAIALIRGEAGTPVVLTIVREGQEEFEVEIIRAQIDIPVVESEMREDGIAYVSLFDFSSDATAKLEAAIEDLLEPGPQGPDPRSAGQSRRLAE